MTHSSDITGYTYKAENYSPEAILPAMGFTYGGPAGPVFTEAYLDMKAEDMGLNRLDEYTFDSDDFPKVILNHSGVEYMITGWESDGAPIYLDPATGEAWNGGDEG